MDLRLKVPEPGRAPPYISAQDVIDVNYSYHLFIICSVAGSLLLLFHLGAGIILQPMRFIADGNPVRHVGCLTLLALPLPEQVQGGLSGRLSWKVRPSSPSSMRASLVPGPW